MLYSTLFYFNLLPFALLQILISLSQTASALTPDEQCNACQKIVFFAFQHYRKTTTKRFLRHKLKHLCKRYYDYRRHCLITVVPKSDVVWSEFERAVPDGAQFKPMPSCVLIKECDKNQSPLQFTEIESSANGDSDDESNGEDEFNFSTSTTPLPTTTSDLPVTVPVDDDK
ncbi:hypothetical protein DdX_14975 [Ditylenchus destructor]|uniref:Saposin B-type domain-containing protein n=1 Tax=Ditylenchus destructor TaxID=166010 RepID=A0AAD4MVW4_9BILA|nr:hypothetical protein DdX_14975 [Ditylenchus destructor]